MEVDNPTPTATTSATTYLLEINLISAQNLHPPSSARMHTYALAYIDPSLKLRTRVDRVGAENPTWNDKFIFRVAPAFLASETSAVCVEIRSVGLLRDALVGSVRIILRNCLKDPNQIPVGGPSFSALQIRRPSGRFQGVLNIGTMVMSDTSFLTGVSAIGYRDLMGGGEIEQKQSKKSSKARRRKKRSNDENQFENNNSSMDTGELSDSNSSCSSISSSTASTAFMDWNGGGGGAGRRELRSDGSSGYLCGLGFQRKDSSESVRSDMAD